MDLLESNVFKGPIIILQMVLAEVQHRSRPLHNHLKALLRADNKEVFILIISIASESVRTFVVTEYLLS